MLKRLVTIFVPAAFVALIAARRGRLVAAALGGGRESLR
jgi:hypothetical protein